MQEIYQESCDKNSILRDGVPYYLVIGIRGKSFEDDLAIPVVKECFSNGTTLKKILEEYLLDKDEDSFIENLQLGNIVEIDVNLRQKLKNTFKQIKDFLQHGEFLEIFSTPLELGADWQIRGQNISERKIQLEDPILNNLIYIEINAPDKGYVDVKQYMARFKISTKPKILNTTQEKPRIEIIDGSKFGPIETPIINYDPDKFKMMRIEIVKKRIDERKKWLPTYSDIDLLYLIFAPIRFIRFKHSQGRLNRSYTEQGKSKPSIISDIRDNSLLGGVWEYKDLEFLMQIDLLVSNKIIVPTDFNYHCPPYTTLYKVIKDGVLLVGDIEHDLKCPRQEEIIRDGAKEIIQKPGQFITYTCMKKMGSEGTQVLIKYQNEIGTTSKMLTCKEMDMEMADMDGNSMKKNPMTGRITKISDSSVKPVSRSVGVRQMGASAEKNTRTSSAKKPIDTAVDISRTAIGGRAKIAEYRSQIYHDPKRKDRGYRG